MEITEDREKNLLQLYKQRLPSWPQVSDDEYMNILKKVLRHSSPRLLDFPDKLIAEIMDSVLYLHADFVEIHEVVPHPDAFDGSVHFIEVHRHWFDRLLVKLRLKSPTWVLSSHSYLKSFSFYK